MRRLVVTALLWSGATAGFAQDAPHGRRPDLPLSVETLPHEPTVVKSGDLITAAYRVRFKDLIADGKEIVVIEDRMAPASLPVAPFDAVALDVRKRQVGKEHIWDFVYRVRIINAAKSTYAIPSFSFYWLMRDLGQKMEEAKVLQYETDPLPVRYVTTMTEDQFLNIRDTIEMESFSRRAAVLRMIGWTIAPLPLVAWVVGLVMALRRPTIAPTMKRGLADEVETVEAQIPELPTLGRARRNLQGQLRTLNDLASNADAAALRDAQRGLVLSLRDYLTAEIPELHSGDTARDIKRHVDTQLPDGRRKEALGALAECFVVHQNGLEQGAATSQGDLAGEAAAIESLLQQLRPCARVMQQVKGFFGRS